MNERRATLAVVIWLIVVSLVILATGGCASGRAPVGEDVMDGLDLEVLEKRPGRAFALYHVTSDGMLAFGGGLDAMQDKTTWSGPLTDAERNQLLELLTRYDLPRAAPASPGTPEGYVYDIDIRWSGEHRKYHVKGASPSVAEIVALLAGAASRRNRDFLQTLPKPGVQE